MASENEPTAAERYKRAVADLDDAQRRLGATPRTAPEARADRTREVEVAMAAVRDAKEAVKADSVRRNFAGLGNTPLCIACGEQLDASTIAALERRALEIQTERDHAAAERRAAKEATAPPTAPPAPASLPHITPRPVSLAAAGRREVEVITRRARAE